MNIVDSTTIMRAMRHEENWTSSTSVQTRPLESRIEGPGKPFSRGPITTSFHRHRDRYDEGVEGYMGRGVPLTVWLGGLGSGADHRPKMIYAYFRSKISHLEHLFSAFFERWQGPQNVVGPGKTSPFPRSRRAWSKREFFPAVQEHPHVSAAKASC